MERKREGEKINKLAKNNKNNNIYIFVITYVRFMVKIKGKIIKVGNSYGFLLQKALVDVGVITLGDEVEADFKLIKPVDISKLDVKQLTKQDREFLKKALATAEEEDEEEFSDSEDNNARYGILPHVLPEHPDLVLVKPVRLMKQSLLVDHPVFEFSRELTLK